MLHGAVGFSGSPGSRAAGPRDALLWRLAGGPRRKSCPHAPASHGLGSDQAGVSREGRETRVPTGPHPPAPGGPCPSPAQTPLWAPLGPLRNPARLCWLPSWRVRGQDGGEWRPEGRPLPGSARLWPRAMLHAGWAKVPAPRAQLRCWCEAGRCWPRPHGLGRGRAHVGQGFLQWEWRPDGLRGTAVTAGRVPGPDLDGLGQPWRVGGRKVLRAGAGKAWTAESTGRGRRQGGALPARAEQTCRMAGGSWKGASQGGLGVDMGTEVNRGGAGLCPPP